MPPHDGSSMEPLYGAVRHVAVRIRHVMQYVG